MHCQTSGSWHYSRYHKQFFLTKANLNSLLGMPGAQQPWADSAPSSEVSVSCLFLTSPFQSSCFPPPRAPAGFESWVGVKVLAVQAGGHESRFQGPMCCFHFVVMNKHADQKQIREERVCFPHASRSQCMTEESQGRNLRLES